MIKIEVDSTRAMIRSQELLTVGLRGAKVHFSFGTPWENLIKTAVFRQGEKTVTVADIGAEVTIPWEVLTEPGLPVLIGVYGTDGETVAIPTVWTATQPVRPGADPEGDPSTEPTPGLWEQIQGKMGSLEKLDTHNKSSLVAAINEANRPVCVITVFENEDGNYVADYDIGMIGAMLDAGIPFACYWYDEEVMLHLADFQTDISFTFTAVSGLKDSETLEYRIDISESGVSCNVNELARKSDIPTRTSQLENDSGFLTTAPVTSVNGQTGDVELKPPLYIVTLDASGRRTEQPFGEIVEAYRLGDIVQLDYYGYLLPLGVVNDTECQFYGISDATSKIVTVRTNSIIAVHERTLASKADIPNKVSELENDQGYATEEYVDNAVSNIPSGGGSYRLPIATPDTLGGVQPVGKTDGMTQNVGVDELGGLWTAPGSGINVNSAIPGQTIVVKEVDETGKPTQWEAADFPAGGGLKETVIFDITTTEPVNEFQIYVDDDEKIALLNSATMVCWRMTLAGDETATDTTGIGTAQLNFCGIPLLPSTSCVPSAENKSWLVGNANGFILRSGLIRSLGIRSPNANKSNIRSLELVVSMAEENVNNNTPKLRTAYLHVWKVNSVSRNDVLKLTTSLPIGTGSRIIVTAISK